MKVKITVPTDLNEITLGQYQNFLKIKDKNDDPYFIQCKLIEIFCNVDALAVRNMKLSDADKIGNLLNKMFQKKASLINTFKLNGVEYGFIPDLNNISFGEYIDLDTNISDWENMHIAMNVLYRPILQRQNNKYRIEKYKTETKDNLINMPLSVVMGSVFFLFHLGRDLSQIMMNYLDNNQKEDLTAYLTSQENGVGINQFTLSLKEMLQDLKISQN